MSVSADPPPALLPWILGGIVAVVTALWAALRSSVAKNEARLEGALQVERDERKREREELRAELRAERDGRQSDNERSAHALWQARAIAVTAAAWEADAPTEVRRVLGVSSMRPVDRVLKRADETDVTAWGEATPPRG